VSEREPDAVLWDFLRGALMTKALGVVADLGIAAAAAGENAWTYGRLHGLEEARADRAERDFWACWPVLGPALKAAVRP
jgi:hypothetical protein